MLAAPNLRMTCELLFFSPRGQLEARGVFSPLEIDHAVIDWASTELVVYLGGQQVGRRGRQYSRP